MTAIHSVGVTGTGTTGNGIVRVRAVADLTRAIGSTAHVRKDGDGGIANRPLAPLIDAAINGVLEGLASPKTSTA